MNLSLVTFRFDAERKTWVMEVKNKRSTILTLGFYGEVVIKVVSLDLIFRIYKLEISFTLLQA